VVHKTSIYLVTELEFKSKKKYGGISYLDTAVHIIC